MRSISSSIGFRLRFPSSVIVGTSLCFPFRVGPHTIFGGVTINTPQICAPNARSRHITCSSTTRENILENTTSHKSHLLARVKDANLCQRILTANLLLLTVATISLLATIMTAASPWWAGGVPTKLLQKQELVREQQQGSSHLPVYTLTFEIPKIESVGGRAQPHHATRVDLGDVVKIVILGYKPKSYSVSALRDNEFDVTCPPNSPLGRGLRQHYGDVYSFSEEGSPGE